MAPEVDQAVFSWSNFLLKLFRRQTPKQFVRSFHVGFPPADCGVDERLLSSHSFTCLPLILQSEKASQARTPEGFRSARPHQTSRLLPYRPPLLLSEFRLSLQHSQISHLMRERACGNVLDNIF